MTRRPIAGVDGCRGHWLVARSPRWPCDRPPDLLVCKAFADVLAATAACDVVTVDMPIGLPDGAAPRACDMEAWALLGGAGKKSVFPAPPRSTLGARTPLMFQALYRQACGKGAPVPLWGIVPKIVEVDAAMSASLQSRIREFHPELAWRRLAGTMLPSKRTDAGVAARARLLSASIRNVHALVLNPPRPARRDDVLDALIGVLVAADAAAGQAERAPSENPAHDARGLRMEIWY
jgi:predicted RNase H-like nuclease